jgi:hypothetical protein
VRKETVGPDSHDVPVNGDFELLRDAAAALRRAGRSRRVIAAELRVRGNRTLDDLLRGEPPPAWTRRPNAKDDLRARARELRAEGKVYAEIAAELGVSKSSVSLWVRDLPKPPPRMTPVQRARHMNEVRWVPELRRREEQRQAVKDAAAGEVGTLSDRELLLVGAVLYWAEGAKDKPYARRESIDFINSDPDVVRVFLRWLDLAGVDPSRRRFRVSIHESADVAAAEAFWAEVAGVSVASFAKPVLKRHVPSTARRNTGGSYRGCLAVRVRGSADLSRRVEGWWFGIVTGVADRRTI